MSIEAPAFTDPLELVRLGARFVEGGRDPRRGIDCLGVCLEVARWAGIPAPDPWAAVADAWQRGERPIGSLMPAGWRRLPWPGVDLEDLDFLVMLERDGAGVEGHCGIVWQGHVISASRSTRGPYAFPVRRQKPFIRQAWRFDR